MKPKKNEEADEFYWNTNMSEWISVEDRLPPNDIYVLVSTYDSRTNVNMYFIQIAARYNDAWVDDHDGELLKTKYGLVKYWMPLPDKPKG